jgi:hypothetical protein
MQCELPNKVKPNPWKPVTVLQACRINPIQPAPDVSKGRVSGVRKEIEKCHRAGQATLSQCAFFFNYHTLSFVHDKSCGAGLAFVLLDVEGKTCDA